jgi:hypothetical protein
VLVVAALVPGTAEAATYCVRVEGAACNHQRPTAAAAFGDARDGDTILLGRVTESGDFGDATGQAIRVVGSGRSATVLAGTVDLGQGGSSMSGLTVRGTLRLSGTARDIAAGGPVQLRSGSALLSSVVDGSVATAGTVNAQSVVVTGTGVDVASGALTAGHLTVFGTGAAGVRVAGGATATVTNSVVWGFARGFQGTANVAFTHVPETGADPGFAAPPADLRLRADSRLVDTGDPAPLDSREPQEDAHGDVRAVDGNGDGTARRDVGALERRPPPPPATAGNLLTNPGAEQGSAAANGTDSFRPPGWMRTGGFTAVRYGVVAGPFPFPSLAAADALGAGRAFFAGGPSGAATITQFVDVSAQAPEIDGGVSAVTLSALLGGYRASADAAIVAAEFRDPFGRRLRELMLDTVTPAERSNATMLAARAAQSAVPRLTRTIAVSVRSGVPGGAYNDAYADDVALVPSYGALRGVPPLAHPERPKRFGGASVLEPRAGVDRKRRAWVRLGCARATVGRCNGVLTLTANRRIAGSLQFHLRPGRMRRLAVSLRRPARGHFPKRRARRVVRLHGHAFLAMRDRQGLTRTLTVPLRLERPRR